MPPASKNELDYPAHVKAMFDLIALGFACDATRIVTFMLGNAASGRTHPFLNITGGHHDISHHMNDAALIAQLAKIGEWEMQQLGYFLRKLKELPDGEDGQSLLHNSTIFCSSEISDGNRHNHDDLPIVLAGSGGGALKTGEHVMFTAAKGAPKQKVSNLLVTMLESAGVTGAQVGDSTGPLTELRAS
jgi:hypothetical protein